MAKLAITAISIALLCASGLAQADGHSDLEAQVKKLQQDKKVLATRLSNAIAFSKERGMQLTSEKSKSKTANNRLRNAIAFSKDRAAQLEASNNKQMAMSTGISGALAQSKKKSARLNMLQQQLDSGKSKNKALSTRLRNAVAFSKERATKLDSATRSSKASSSRLRNAIAFSKERGNQLASEKKKNKVLARRLRNAIAYSKERANRQSDWASTVSTNLDAAVGGVQGTSVLTVDNAVNVQVGNNGLFNTGGTALSAGGSELLSAIAQQLATVDANITVVGHTDNIPVGSGSIFGSNEELSFARAVSTLQFLRDQGIRNEQLSAAGYGASTPVAGNDTAEGRAQNRRVEIILRQQ